MSEVAKEEMDGIGARPVVVPINAEQDEPKREPGPLPAPMSPTARVIFDRSTAAVLAAKAVWEQAQEEHRVALCAALKLDDLPPFGMGPGELRNIGREGNEWVEPEQSRR